MARLLFQGDLNLNLQYCNNDRTARDVKVKVEIYMVTSIIRILFIKGKL